MHVIEGTTTRRLAIHLADDSTIPLEGDMDLTSILSTKPEQPRVELNTTLSVKLSIRLTKSQLRQLKHLGNPGAKAWHHWATVKHNQERRRLRRKHRR